MTIDPADHVGLARHFARRYGRNVPDPEAVLEIAFLTLVRAARRFGEGPGHWPAYASACIAPAVRGEVGRQLRTPRETSLFILGENGDEDERRDLPHVEPVGTARLESEAIRAAVLLLPPRQARLVALRFGLEDGRERTHDELAALLEISRTRVGQLERMALRALRRILSRRRAARIRTGGQA